MATVDELEGRLENAKDSYSDQREKIVELKDTIKQLEVQVKDLEASEDEAVVNLR